MSAALADAMPRTIAERIAALDWSAIGADMDRQGWAVLPSLLGEDETDDLAALWDEAAFRSRIIMERYAFGRGEYRYFANPLPDPVQAMRTHLYAPLAGIANRWNEMLGFAHRYPDAHASLIAQCHAGGQQRPTPLMLDYKPGDYCCLHQDLYGALLFPIQAVALLRDDCTGGELVLTEQGRDAPRAEVVPLKRGDVLLFAVNERPVRGARGYVRVKMRHGVSAVRSGHRRTLGIIFHDAH